MDNLLYSVNATMPVFLVMAVGWCLKQIGLLNEEFCKVADKLVFAVAVPLMLFFNMADTDLKQEFDVRFVGFCVVASTLCCLLCWALAKLCIRDKSVVGEVAQCSFRAGTAILGVAFLNNIYGSSVAAPQMILGCVPLYNVFVVLVLTMENPNGRRDGNLLAKMGSVVKGVLTNPMVLGIAAGTLYSLSPIKFPALILKTGRNLAALASPLALLSIGASFKGAAAIRRLGPTLFATFVKLILMVAIFLPFGLRMGFRNDQVVAMLIMLGSPTTPTSHVMARNMGHEGVVSGSCIAATTLLSALTLTGWIWLMRSLGYMM